MTSLSPSQPPAASAGFGLTDDQVTSSRSSLFDQDRAQIGPRGCPGGGAGVQGACADEKTRVLSVIEAKIKEQRNRSKPS